MKNEWLVYGGGGLQAQTTASQMVQAQASQNQAAQQAQGLGLSEQSLGNQEVNGESLLQAAQVQGLLGMNTMVSFQWQEPAPTPRPTEMELTWAIWQTDPRVIARLDEVGDWKVSTSVSVTLLVEDKKQRMCVLPMQDMAKRKAVLHKMWSRDEGGWRTEATTRAKEILVALEVAGRVPPIRSPHGGVK